MAFIPGFEYDIFISYAHVDNLALEGEMKWVEQFHKQLEIALAKRIGRVGIVKIWRDKRLEGDQLFDETIQNSVDNSALFLALTSNGYLASDYCKDELQAFHRKAQTEQYGLQIEDRSRIYNVLLNNISHDDWTDEYPRTSGHLFHDAEENDSLGQPSELTGKKFFKQLWALVDSIYHMLLAFEKSSKKSSKKSSNNSETDNEEEGETVIAGKEQSVFLADISDSLRPVQTRIINELKREKINVTSSIPPPYDANAHEEKVNTVLGESVLSVHMFDSFAGREVDGEPGITYPQKQVELAKDNVGAQLIWVPKNLEMEKIEEETHKNFLTKLEKGKRDKTSYEFMRGTTTSIVPHIVEKLNQMSSVATTDGASQAVLLDTHLKDQIYALELSRFFLENNIQPYINPQEDDPNKNMGALETRLKEVSMLMILFGSVKENWVRQRLGAALQLSVIDKNCPIKSFCVLTVPPEKRSDSLNFSIGQFPVHLIDNSRSKELDLEALTPVLKSIQNGGTV